MVGDRPLRKKNKNLFFFGVDLLPRISPRASLKEWLQHSGTDRCELCRQEFRFRQVNIEYTAYETLRLLGLLAQTVVTHSLQISAVALRALAAVGLWLFIMPVVVRILWRLMVSFDLAPMKNYSRHFLRSAMFDQLKSEPWPTLPVLPTANGSRKSVLVSGQSCISRRLT